MSSAGMADRTPRSSERSPARRLVLAGALAGLLVVVVEALAWIAVWGTTGRRFTYGAPPPLAHAAATAGGAASADDAAAVAAPARESPPGGAPITGSGPTAAGGRFAVQREIVHPFLGFVQNPGVRLVPQGSGWRVRSAITPHGFYDFARPPAGPDRVRVVVLGGSLAVHLVRDAGEHLAALLARDPRWSGRPVDVVNWANPGYKQPHQLITLAYLVAMGEQPDLVINLDGYNDVVLGYTDNLAAGVNPFFPRAWAWRVEAFPDPQVLPLLGEASLWQRRRAALAARADGWLVRHSALASLAAAALDRELARRVTAAEAAARELAANQAHDYLRHGPPFPLQDEEAFLAAAAAVWRRSSLELAALCRGLGVPYHHFLQPNQYVAGAKPMGREERARALDEHDTGGRLVAAGYPRLAASGEDLRAAGVAFVDLRAVFAGVDEPLYVDPCCHVSPAGSRLLAEAIARAVSGGQPARRPAASR